MWRGLSEVAGVRALPPPPMVFTCPLTQHRLAVKTVKQRVGLGCKALKR